jgi:ketosteroid isomerase-like protein
MRHYREAIGRDGEQYAWTRLLVAEVRDGRLASMCDFDVDDEDEAFAYAEERMRAASSRLTVSNRASEVTYVGLDALQARDIETQLSVYSDQFVYDDRRRLSGHPIENRAELRAAMERIHDQYSHFEWRILAVRGERLYLGWSRWADDAGNESTYLHVGEIDDDGRITYDGRFDEDDFEGAYRELDRRYYAGEGAAFAEAGEVSAAWITAVNRGDFDRAFGELCAPELRVENRSRSAFPDRSAAEVRATLEELNTMVASARTWHAVVCWLSPTWGVFRQPREAIGPDGEDYSWVRVHVCEFRDGRFASVCEFEFDDEEAAFAYAEERIRATSRRLLN